MRFFVASHTGLPSVVTDPIGKGIRYSIRGEAWGVSWLVDEGVGVGAAVAVSDPAAPFGAVTYSVSVGGVVVSGVLDRPHGKSWGVDTLFTSMDGRASVHATWEGDAPLSWSPGASYAQPQNRRRPFQFLPLQPAGHRWGLEFRVDLGMVATAQRVLERGLFWVTHVPEACDGGSTIPRVMLAGVDGDVSEGRWPEGRTYSLSLVELDAGASGVPVVTWGEASRAGIVWGPATTFASIRESIGGA